MKMYPNRISHFAFLMMAGAPTLVDASMLAQTDQCIRVDLTPMTGPAGDYLIGITEMGDAVAVKADVGGELKSLGLGSFGLDGLLHFAEADLRSSGSKISVLAKLGEKKQLVANDDQALKIDPRLLALIFKTAGHGEKLGRLMMKNEGLEMSFGHQAQIGAGTEADVTMVTVAKKQFLVAVVKGEDTVLITEVVKTGTTWISVGSFGHQEDGDIVDVTVSELAAFGIGIPPASTIAATGAGHTKQAVAAA